jgi:hypothetical protein
MVMRSHIALATPTQFVLVTDLRAGADLRSMADGALIAEENSLPLMTHIAVDRGT